jgi:AraC-like DNA-binding protein
MALVSHRCSVDEAAALFGIHRRTLHRRLKREGVTFDALVEDVRADLAQELLAARNTRPRDRRDARLRRRERLLEGLSPLVRHDAGPVAQ